MEWRIREAGHGGYVAERGCRHGGGVPSPRGVGVTMPAYIVYEAARFDTEKQAAEYIKRRTKK